MASVASTSSQGMTDLIQILTSSTSPLAASGMSTSQIQSLAQNASPGDIVKLSNQALKYQEMTALFGDSPASTDTTSSDSGTSFDSLMASLSANSAQTTDSLQSLFGTSIASPAGTSVNTLA